MATETSTQTAETGGQMVERVVKPVLESAAVNGLGGSLLIIYSLGILVLNEVLGEVLADTPGWFMLAVNTAIGIPVIATMIVLAGWWISVLHREPADWRALILYSTGASVIATPVLLWLAGLVGF